MDPPSLKGRHVELIELAKQTPRYIYTIKTKCSMFSINELIQALRVRKHTADGRRHSRDTTVSVGTNQLL